MEPFEWIDDHSGSVVALGTVALVLVTAVYVALTQRLVRAQHLGTKREIVEKVFKPISDKLDEMIWGERPNFDIWTTLKEEQPFLAYHHIIPSEIREGLDGLSDTWATSGEAVFKTLLVEINREADKRGGTTHNDPWASFHYRRPGRDGFWVTPLHELIISNKSVADAMRISGLDSAVNLRLELAESGELGERCDVSKEAVTTLVQDVTSTLNARESSRELLTQHRDFLARAERVYRMVTRQIEIGSRV